MNKFKKGVPLFAAAFSILIAAVLVFGAAAAPDPFRGKWYSVDVDGSDQVLTIGGGPGGSYHVRYHDYGATVCGDPVGGVWPYGASATGFLAGSGSSITGTLPVYCLASPPTHYGDIGFTFFLVGDTLVQPQGLDTVVWHR